MKNRAKCKLCQRTVESFFKGDYVECECGEIAVFDGDAMRCAAKDFKNFIRVDEKGKEIMVTTQKDEALSPVDTLKFFIDTIKDLPDHVRQSPATYDDLLTFAGLVLDVFKADC